ncbi:MAG: hypothetical protein MUQ30_06425 [Anaerolineae bacterium]|nr:hypothetical protein [Anaerolineae bacterium]
MLGLTVWFLAGAGLSVVHFALLLGLVSRLDPASPKRDLNRRVRRSYAIRYLSLVVVLTTAIRQSIGAGIAVAVGFWLVRWAGVYVGATGRIDWSQLE